MKKHHNIENVAKTLNEDRLFFIDFLKAISIIIVVSFHAIFVPISTYETVWIDLESLFAPLKFCVPVLLVISFFLLERSIDRRRQTNFWLIIKQRLIRLAIPTFFWTSVMQILAVIKGDYRSGLELILRVLRGQMFTGAYFLIVMFELLVLYGIFKYLGQNRQRVLIVIAFQCLFMIGIHLAVSQTSLIPAINFVRVFGLPFVFYWTIYPVLGIYAYHHFEQIRSVCQITVKVKLFLLCSYSLLAGLEYRWLLQSAEGMAISLDYALISCVFSVFILFLCFTSVTEKQLPSSVVATIKLLSQYSLGIFCINGIASRLFLAIGSQLFAENSFNLVQMLGIKLIGWAFLLVFSLSLALLLKRLGLKQMVC